VRRRFTQWDKPSLAPTLPVDQEGNVTLVWAFFDSPASGSSLESTHWLANGTGASGPPGAPGNVSATVGGNTINVRWSPPTSGGAPTSYTLIGRLTAGGPVLATVPMGNLTSFSVAAPNGTFVLSVTAANASGTGPESASVTVTVPQTASPPGAPSNFAASVTGTTVSFTWSPPSSGGAVANYVLLAGLTPGFSVPFATVSLGSTPGSVVPGVPAGTFYVRVVAQNAGGTSAPSNEVVFTVAGTAPPGAPTLHTPTVTGSTVNLSWTAGSGATPTGYTLAASVTPDGAPIVTVPLTGTAASFAGVPSGTYYLRLTASNAAGTSPPSAQVTLTVP
jgi:predicted phage tail protein